MRLPSAITPEITSAIAPEIVGRATCPLCHTVDPTMTNIALSAGADWHCSRCGQRWDTLRLAAVAGYAVWLSACTERVRHPTITQQQQEVALLGWVGHIRI